MRRQTAGGKRRRGGRVVSRRRRATIARFGCEMQRGGCKPAAAARRAIQSRSGVGSLAGGSARRVDSQVHLGNPAEPGGAHCAGLGLTCRLHRHGAPGCWEGFVSLLRICKWRRRADGGRRLQPPPAGRAVHGGRGQVAAAQASLWLQVWHSGDKHCMLLAHSHVVAPGVVKPSDCMAVDGRAAGSGVGPASGKQRAVRMQVHACEAVWTGDQSKGEYVGITYVCARIYKLKCTKAGKQCGDPCGWDAGTCCQTHLKRPGPSSARLAPLNACCAGP